MCMDVYLVIQNPLATSRIYLAFGSSILYDCVHGHN